MRRKVILGAQESKQVVRDLYAAFGRGDIAALLALVAEDMVWRMPGTVPTIREPTEVRVAWPASCGSSTLTFESNPSNQANSSQRLTASSPLGGLVAGRRAHVPYSIIPGSWPSIFPP